MHRELIIESDKAYDLAHSLAAQLGMTVDQVVEEALVHYAKKLGLYDRIEQDRRPASSTQDQKPSART